MALARAARSFLQARNMSQRPIRYLSVTFYMRKKSMGIVRTVDDAMSLAAGRGVVTAKLKFPGKKIDYACDGRDMASMLRTCGKLKRLSLLNCDSGRGTVLALEHPELTKLKLVTCDAVDLRWLPKPGDMLELGFLHRMMGIRCCLATSRGFGLDRTGVAQKMSWPQTEDELYPLSLGYVPQLSILKLSNEASIMHKTIRLSELLGNATISSLDLDFVCERICIESEASEVLRPLFQNLQVLNLQRIHEEFGIIHVTTAKRNGKICIMKGYNLPTWEAPADLKHCESTHNQGLSGRGEVHQIHKTRRGSSSESRSDRIDWH
ncbi:hypothetical protein BAE44_0020128 [Dichanthelium oligosanthes]|uniref:F-box protein n=1 Tax=Dichanthelium oligosanthes TaxID=888268 RepID=A0A1E5V122_9POAL|nr:hypothetical protein BAE44_0020128 [Dichanthelium oligosanthes]